MPRWAPIFEHYRCCLRRLWPFMRWRLAGWTLRVSSLAHFLFSLCFLWADENVVSQISAPAALPFSGTLSKTNSLFFELLFIIAFYYSNSKVINMTSQTEHLYWFKNQRKKVEKQHFLEFIFSSTQLPRSLIFNISFKFWYSFQTLINFKLAISSLFFGVFKSQSK